MTCSTRPAWGEDEVLNSYLQLFSSIWVDRELRYWDIFILNTWEELYDQICEIIKRVWRKKKTIISFLTPVLMPNWASQKLTLLWQIKSNHDNYKKNIGLFAYNCIFLRMNVTMCLQGSVFFKDKKKEIAYKNKAKGLGYKLMLTIFSRGFMYHYVLWVVVSLIIKNWIIPSCNPRDLIGTAAVVCEP